jgi:hypothetical protein
MFAPRNLPVSRIARVFYCIRQIALDRTLAELSGNSVTEIGFLRTKPIFFAISGRSTKNTPLIFQRGVCKFA